MAADEEVQAQQQEEKPSSGPAISGKGWMIVIGIVVIQWIAFGAFIIMGRTDSKSTDGADQLVQKIEAGAVNKYKVEYNDLTYSKSSTGANKVNILMSLELILGPTQEELDSSTGEFPPDEAMAEFQVAVKSLQPNILDHLQEIVDNMTVTQLDKQEGKASIRRRLMDYINERLEGIKFPNIDKKWSRKRVTEVLFTKYLVQ